MRAAAATLTLLAAGALAGCGARALDAEGYRTAVVAGCAGVSTGAEALHADGRPPAERVRAAIERATGAARELGAVRPPEGDRERHQVAVRALQGQAARLRAVRDQLERGSAPARVLSAARASLEDGDAQARARLVQAGADCAALVATQPGG